MVAKFQNLKQLLQTTCCIGFQSQILLTKNATFLGLKKYKTFVHKNFVAQWNGAQNSQQLAHVKLQVRNPAK